VDREPAAGTARATNQPAPQNRGAFFAPTARKVKTLTTGGCQGLLVECVLLGDATRSNLCPYQRRGTSLRSLFGPPRKEKAPAGAAGQGAQFG
jgi:hypothetical protein